MQEVCKRCTGRLLELRKKYTIARAVCRVRAKCAAVRHQEMHSTQAGDAQELCCQEVRRAGDQEVCKKYVSSCVDWTVPYIAIGDTHVLKCAVTLT